MEEPGAEARSDAITTAPGMTRKGPEAEDQGRPGTGRALRSFRGQGGASPLVGKEGRGGKSSRRGRPRTEKGAPGTSEESPRGQRGSPISVFRHWPEAVSQIRLQSKQVVKKQVTASGVRAALIKPL